MKRDTDRIVLPIITVGKRRFAYWDAAVPEFGIGSYDLPVYDVTDLRTHDDGVPVDLLFDIPWGAKILPKRATIDGCRTEDCIHDIGPFQVERATLKITTRAKVQR